SLRHLTRSREPASSRLASHTLKIRRHLPMPNKELYFEDFHIGQRFDSVGTYTVTTQEIKEFGQKYDPQPFHLDEAAGEGSFFHGLAASGWLTAAIVMRLRVLSIQARR